MVVFTLDYPTTPVFTHIILSSLKFIQFYFIHLEAARMNSGKHQKLWQAHRPTFFDVLIPCFFSSTFPQVQRVLVVLLVRGQGA